MGRENGIGSEQGSEHAADRAAGVTRVATLLSFPPEPGTGLGTFIIGMTDALRRNTRLSLVMVAPDSDRSEAGRPGSQILFAFQQLLQLRRVRPDVVHTHDHPALLAAAVGYRTLASGHVRVVYTSHLDPVEKRSILKRRVLGWLLRRCDAVTVAARDTISKMPLLATPAPAAGRVRVVPGAGTVRVREQSDPEVAAFAASLGLRASLGRRGSPVLLQVSNFVFPAKVEGTLLLMEAMALVIRTYPDAHLVLLGTGPLLHVAQQTRERLGLTRSVTLPGVFIKDLSLALGLADIHCHITLQDACPLSIVEAMHAGKPIVASRTGGIPEMLEHGADGVLVGNSREEIAASIIDLIEQPALAATLGARAQQTAQSRYSWERVAADFETIYGVPSRQRADPSRTAVPLRAD